VEALTAALGVVGGKRGPGAVRTREDVVGDERRALAALHERDEVGCGLRITAGRERCGDISQRRREEHRRRRDPEHRRRGRAVEASAGRRLHPSRVRAAACQTPRMRLLVARCSVVYEGRLGARLGSAVRLLVCKADGSIAIHSDSGAYKPLNWMNPPCTLDETDEEIVARNPKGETLRIQLEDVVHDISLDLGEDKGLEKDGVEAELQRLLAARVAALRDDLTLVRREYPTDIGPVDLLCRDGDGRAIVIEVKRVGEIAGVDQLLRYVDRLDRDPGLAPTAGMFVAQVIKPQAKVYAESKGVAWIEIDLERLRGDLDPDLTLF
jgi:RecB family endonuclease NucS